MLLCGLVGSCEQISTLNIGVYSSERVGVDVEFEPIRYFGENVPYFQRDSISTALYQSRKSASYHLCVKIT